MLDTFNARVAKHASLWVCVHKYCSHPCIQRVGYFYYNDHGIIEFWSPSLMLTGKPLCYVLYNCTSYCFVLIWSCYFIVDSIIIKNVTQERNCKLWLCPNIVICSFFNWIIVALIYHPKDFSMSFDDNHASKKIWTAFIMYHVYIDTSSTKYPLFITTCANATQQQNHQLTDFTRTAQVSIQIPIEFDWDEQSLQHGLP